MDADRLVFLDDRDFGTEVELVPPEGDTVALTAIFDNAYLEVSELGDSAGVGTTGPRLLCRSIDVDAVEEGWLARVGGREYSVRREKPDGTGMTVLELHDAAHA